MTSLQSVHTTNFPELLHQLGISLVISTYQAGKLIVLRADGNSLNTHFKDCNQPMGIAAEGEKMAIATRQQIWEYHNNRDVARTLPPIGRHDACYLPRRSHITGDIQIRDMAYIQGELWFVNSRFSCLCTLDATHSFVPRWRPHFVTAYDLSDRCHLNGLGVRDQEARYATAFGETDSPEGWRANLARGGVLIDIATNKILCRGLSLPHSPRWYAHRLWLLEAGEGGLVEVDPHTGTWRTVCQLPGFTRGLDFWGPLAFIGLSQLRETGLPLSQRLSEQVCGVWVVNIYSGEIVAFLKFQAVVQEILAVTILANIRYPEICEEQDPLLSRAHVLPNAALRELALAAPISPVPAGTVVPPPIDAVAVIVPVYNLERLAGHAWQQTLLSIETSLNYFRQQDAQTARIPGQIVIVDDASTDNSWHLLQAYTQGKPYYHLIRHDRNQGQAAARNTGVKASKGKAILFCDDDDLYLSEHVAMVVNALNTPLPSGNQPLLPLPGNYPAAVKMGVRYSEPVHPDWQEPIRSCLVLNLGIRREAHEFIGGLPEDPVFRETIYAQEDCAYHQWLLAFFNVLWLEPETVVYQRHPGNHFDLQLAKFQKAAAADQTLLSASEQRYQVEIAEIVRQRKIALHTKLQQLQERDRLFEQGNQCFGQDQFSQAVEFYRQALQLDPDFLVARYNLGVSYLGLEQWPEANHWLEQVVETDPSHAAAHNNLGLVAFLQGQMQLALEHFRRAIAVAPDFADAHLNLALALFHTGDFLGGWQAYEWRLKTPQVPPFVCGHPRWQGHPAPNQTILIHTEQGSGDAIQFARYLPLVKERFGRVLLVCIPELAELLGTTPGVDQVLLPGNINLDQFQTYTSLMSLPLLFQTTAETIPQQVPYLQVPAHSNFSLPTAQGAVPRLKVGLIWAGSPTHRDDRRRSCKLTDYLPLLSVAHIHFYSLQKRLTVAEQAQLRDFGIVDLSEQLNTFADTAAAIAQLDLVISVDTSVVHLVGALAKPVWTLLCFCPDWRWGLQDNVTPWYPTMRLFRQPAAHQWQPVLREVTESLKRYKPTGKGKKA
jgi:uncharacterized protein (TIGR03032 family)